MKSFATSITIGTRAETIWALLTDAARYPQWNSTVEKIEGHIAAGAKVTVYAKAAPGRAFPLKVIEFMPSERMVWAGGMPLGLFTGSRRFTLAPAVNGAIAFAMREDYSGLLAGLIDRSPTSSQHSTPSPPI